MNTINGIILIAELLFGAYVLHSQSLFKSWSKDIKYGCYLGLAFAILSIVVQFVLVGYLLPFVLNLCKEILK